MQSFDDLAFDAQIRYVGPSDFDGEWRAPRDMHAPYSFRHTSIYGSLTLLTRFNAPRYLAPEHPANDPAHWERVDA